MWAGPVSLATTKELSLIRDVNWDKFKALSLSRTLMASNFLASSISLCPGDVTIFYSEPNLSLINTISSS